jgi:hypothetical protein
MEEPDALDLLLQEAEVAIPHALEKHQAAADAFDPDEPDDPDEDGDDCDLVVPATDTAPVPPPAPQPKPKPAPAPQPALTDAPTSDKPLRNPIKLPAWLHTPRPSPDARLVAGLLAGLVSVFASGVAFGLLLSHAAPYAYLTTSLPIYIIAPLEAPAGIVLFLLAAVLLWSYGHDRNSRLLKIIGWLFLILFLGGIL